jgi:formamidopyrimidine-DNA glycosylase
MPEGAEVKIIGEDLAKWVSKQKILNIEIVSGRYLKKEMQGLTYVIANLPIEVVGIGVHGKFLYWITRSDIFIYSTLGMTGTWSRNKTKHTRVIFHTSNGNVCFNDQRNFGTIKFVEGRSSLILKLTSLGPDMLSENISNEKFLSCFRNKKNWAISKALMDQSVVSGIGNYVKSESLWRAKISPHRIIEAMSEEELLLVKKYCQEVLIESYSAGATLSEDGMNRIKGQYNTRFAVYNNTKDPDGNTVIKEATPDGRNTYWVPSVQL